MRTDENTCRVLMCSYRYEYIRFLRGNARHGVQSHVLLLAVVVLQQIDSMRYRPVDAKTEP